VSLSLLVAGSLALSLFYEFIYVGAFFILRIFFIPAKLVYVYYQFFDNNSFIYWSNSFASFLFDYPYSESPARVVGNYLGTGESANNSFLATGYMHAGILGVLIYCISVGFIFKLIDSLVYRRVPVYIAVASTIVP